MKSYNKLKEAEFFLNKIRESKNEKELNYHISAFLSSARSSFFYLGKELSKREGFSEWYNKKENQFKQDSYLKSLKNKRNDSIHTGNLPLLEGQFFHIKKNKITKPKFNPYNFFMHQIDKKGKTAIFEQTPYFLEKLYRKLQGIITEAYQMFDNAPSYKKPKNTSILNFWAKTKNSPPK